MTYDNARKLADDLHNSAEYATFCTARDAAFESEATKSLLTEYHKLQMKAQAAMMAGDRNEELMQKLQKMGELLQFDNAAAAYLLAEYRLNTMLGDVYKILAEAIDVDLSALEG